MSTNSRELNYIALAACIIGNISPDVALKSVLPEMRSNKSKTAAARTAIVGDTEEMIRMRSEGMTFEKVGEQFGVSAGSVCQRIRRYEMRMGNEKEAG